MEELRSGTHGGYIYPVTRFNVRTVYPGGIPTVMANYIREIQDDGFVAGGYARYIADPKCMPTPGDIDVYSKHADRMPLPPAGAKLLFETDYAQTYKWEGWGFLVQLVKPQNRNGRLTYGKPEQVIRQFDLNVCQFALEGHGSEINLIAPDIVESMRPGNEVFLTGPIVDDPVDTLFRLTKYARKGYRVSRATVVQCIRDYEDLEAGDQDDLLQRWFSDSDTENLPLYEAPEDDLPW